MGESVGKFENAHRKYGHLKPRYRLAKDGVSLWSESGPGQVQEKISRTDHAGFTREVYPDTLFNRGVKRGDTILVTGDRPWFALMRTFPEDRLDPDLIKLGDCRVRVTEGESSCWLDECESIKTVFNPGSTEYRVRLTPGEGFENIRLSYTVCQACDFGAAALVEVSREEAGTSGLQIEFVFGGITRCGRTFSASYFKPDPGETPGNSVEFHESCAVLQGENIGEWAAAYAGEKAERAVSGTRAVFRWNLSLSGERIERAWAMTGRSGERQSLVDMLRHTQPEQCLKESTEYYRELLSQYQIDTPEPILDSGFMTAVLNLDYAYCTPGWLEGVHWWSAYWNNNYQISAAIALGQFERAAKALEFFAGAEDGPGPILQASGKPAIQGSHKTEEWLLYYIYELMQYVEYTGDTEILEKLWERLAAAIEHLCKARDADGDGLLDWHYSSNPFLYQADHLGMPGAAASPSMMLAGMLERLGKAAETIKRYDQGQKWKAQAVEIHSRLIDRLWNREKGVFYSHADLQGIRHMAHYYTDLCFPLLYTSLPPQYGWQSLHYADENLWVDNAFGEPCLMRVGEYKPSIFGNDNVMPAQMAEAARAYFRKGDAQRGAALLEYTALAGTILTEAPGNFPERMSDEGKGEANYIFGNPIGSFLYAMVEGLFGLSLTEGGTRLCCSPAFPDHWDHASIKLPWARLEYRGEREDEFEVKYYRIEGSGRKKLGFSLLLEPGEELSVTESGGRIDYQTEPGLVRTKLILDFPEGKGVYDIQVRYRKLEIKPEGGLDLNPGEETCWCIPVPVAELIDLQGALQEYDIGNKDEGSCCIRILAAHHIGQHMLLLKPARLNLYIPVYIHIKDENEKLGGTTAQGIEKAALEALPIDLTPFFNAGRMFADSCWRSDTNYKIDTAALSGGSGRIQTPEGDFRVAAGGNNMVMAEFGRSDRYTRQTLKTDMPDHVEILVGTAAEQIVLLYASETECRNTGEHVGNLTLRYDGGEETTLPLVVGKNIDALFKHTAADTVPFPVSEDPDCHDYLNILTIPCNSGRVLSSISVSLFAADVQMGILALNVMMKKPEST